MIPTTIARPQSMCPRCMTGRMFREPASHHDGPGATDLVCIACGHIEYDRAPDPAPPSQTSRLDVNANRGNLAGACECERFR